jgi:hypothetical protein
MALDLRGLRFLTARQLIAALMRDGFYFIRADVKSGRERDSRGVRPTRYDPAVFFFCRYDPNVEKR